MDIAVDVRTYYVGIFTRSFRLFQDSKRQERFNMVVFLQSSLVTWCAMGL